MNAPVHAKAYNLPLRSKLLDWLEASPQKVASPQQWQWAEATSKQNVLEMQVYPRQRGKARQCLFGRLRRFGLFLCGVVAARYRLQRKCILFIAATSWRRHEHKAPSPSRHRYCLRVVSINKKTMPDKPPGTGFFIATHHPEYQVCPSRYRYPSAPRDSPQS